MAKAHKLAAPGTVPHGWRSTFRDWAAEATDYPADVCEAALAHLIGNATTRSYQRGTMLDKRRALMNDWAAYLAPPPIQAMKPVAFSGEVIAFVPRHEAQS
jgi:integrase